MGRRKRLKELIPMEVIVTTAVDSSNTVVREIFMVEKRRSLCLCQTIEGSVKQVVVHVEKISHFVRDDSRII
jgi:hypothetical protein